MALRRKPEAQAKPDERHIDDVINRGGSIATVEPPADEGKLSLVQLRLRQTLIERIDQARARRTVPPPRHAWMLEALLEKLAREEQAR